MVFTKFRDAGRLGIATQEKENENRSALYEIKGYRILSCESVAAAHIQSTKSNDQLAEQGYS